MIYILYGSQTGNAEEISTNIYYLLNEKKYECIHSSLNKTLLNDSFNFIPEITSSNNICNSNIKVEKNFSISEENLLEFSGSNDSIQRIPGGLAPEVETLDTAEPIGSALTRACERLQLIRQNIVIIICSTTGNGDAPETANFFWRKIKNQKLPKDLLKGIKYAVLGLGDTNYDKFCEMGKKIDKRFNDLGAERFIELHCADEATSLEETVELFKEKLLEYFEKL